MRRFTLVFALLLGITATAQIRTGSDNANGNFVIGLDNYLRFTVSSAGTAGFDFSTHGKVFKAIVVGQSVEVTEVGGGQTAIYSDGRYRLAPARPSLSIPSLGVNDTGRFLDTNEIVVGVHDFTNDREPELVVALRDISGKGAHGNGLVVYVLEFQDGKWRSCGEIAAFGPDVEEARVFRQVITINEGENFYNWTYRGKAFDFRGNGKSTDPSSAFSAAL